MDKEAYISRFFVFKKANENSMKEHVLCIEQVVLKGTTMSSLDYKKYQITISIQVVHERRVNSSCLQRIATLV